jgi:hypothetical protein
LQQYAMTDISGTWLGTYWEQGEPTRFEMTLVQGGQQITGNILDDGALGEAQVVGTLTGRRIQFSKRYLAAHSHTLEYSGTLLDDFMQGTWMVIGDAGGQWEARRQGDPLMAALQARLSQQLTSSARG